MLGRVIGVVSWIGGVAMGAGLLACGQAASEAPAREGAAITVGVGTTLVENPVTFPDGLTPHSCEPIDSSTRTARYSNYMALHTTGSTDVNGRTDPYTTTFSHGYRWNESWPTWPECGSDSRCEHELDLLGGDLDSAHDHITSGQAFIYKVVPIGFGSECPRTADSTEPTYCVLGAAMVIQALQRIDETTHWTRPWQYQSPVGAAPWTTLDASSHPPMGADARSEDWGLLWDVVSTYAADPAVDAQEVHCANIYGQPAVAGAAPQLIDFFVAADYYDPMGHDW
jgi:hypothetical protein